MERKLMKPEKAITSFYSDQIEILGGILAVHRGKIKEELIWIICKNLHQGYLDTMEAFEVMEKIKEENEKTETVKLGSDKPHPAIVHILKELKGGSK